MYFVLLKSIFKNSFRSGGGAAGKKKGAQLSSLAGMLLSGAIFGALFVMMTVLIGPAYVKAGARADFLCTIFFSAQIIVLLFGTVVMVNILYFSSDAEMLLSLPVRPVTVFAAKLTYVYVTELTLSAFTCLVAGVAFGIVGAFGPLYYLLLLPATLVVPLLPLLLSAVLCIPILYAVSFFRGKSLLTTILLVVLFGGFLYFYMSFAMNMGYAAEGEIDPDSYIQSVRFFSNILPNASLALLTTGASANVPADVGIVLGFNIGFLAAALGLAVPAYGRGMSSQLEEHRSASNKAAVYAKNSAFMTLLKKDVKEILRNPGFAFYCVIQFIMAPILMLFISGTISGVESDSAGAEELLRVVSTAGHMLFVAMMTMGMNYTAITAISREGANFNMAKNLPAPFAFQVRVKVRLSDAVACIGLTLAAALMLASGDDVLQTLLFFGFCLISANAMNHMLVYADAKNPRLNWENIMTTLRNNKIAFLSLGIAMLLGVPLITGYVLISLSTDGALFYVLFSVFWAVLYGAAILFNALSRKRLYNNIERMIADCE
jgi:ABC-2 type transport system permease protein